MNQSAGAENSTVNRSLPRGGSSTGRPKEERVSNPSADEVRDAEIADLQNRTKIVENAGDSLMRRLEAIVSDVARGERYAEDLDSLAADLQKRIDDLERRVAALEARPIYIPVPIDVPHRRYPPPEWQIVNTPAHYCPPGGMAYSEVNHGDR